MQFSIEHDLIIYNDNKQTICLLTSKIFRIETKFRHRYNLVLTTQISSKRLNNDKLYFHRSYDSRWFNQITVCLKTSHIRSAVQFSESQKGNNEILIEKMMYKKTVLIMNQINFFFQFFNFSNWRNVLNRFDFNEINHNFSSNQSFQWLCKHFVAVAYLNNLYHYFTYCFRKIDNVQTFLRLKKTANVCDRIHWKSKNN